MDIKIEKRDGKFRRQNIRGRRTIFGLVFYRNDKYPKEVGVVIFDKLKLYRRETNDGVEFSFDYVERVR